MKDRFLNGFIAGVLGGVVMSTLNIFSYALGIAEILYLDWASVLIFGYRYATLTEAVIGQIGQLFFSGVVGIIFAYLILMIKSRSYYFKGWVYGLTVWFGAYAATTVFKLTPLVPVRPDTVMSNLVTASLYGITLAKVLQWLSDRKKLNS